MYDEDGDAILCDECGEQVGNDAVEVYDEDGASVWFCAACYVNEVDEADEGGNNDIPF